MMGEAVTQAGRCGAIEWAVCASAYPGQTRSGDAFLVQQTGAGVQLAVVDGLGHGEEASDVAELALASLRETAQQPLIRSLTLCHDALRGSRGVVMTLAILDPDREQLVWLAVGNVDAAVLRPRSGGQPVKRCSVPMRAGVVGDRLPGLREATVAMAAGDTLVAATDGISRAFLDQIDLSLEVPALARALHRRYSRNDDDALVLVARYRAPDGGTGQAVTAPPSR